MSGAKFGTAQDLIVKPCAICNESVNDLENRLVVEKETIHKSCFKCAFCDTRLQMGYCVIDLALYDRFGPCWFCTLICAHKPTNEKVAKLKEKGRRQKEGAKVPTEERAPKQPSPQPVEPVAEPPKGPTEKGPLLNVFSALK